MSGAFVFFGSIGGKAEASECGVNACAVPGLLQGGFRHRFLRIGMCFYAVVYLTSILRI